MNFVIFVANWYIQNYSLSRLAKSCHKPIGVCDETVIKCVDAHLGVFTRFLEHITLEQISTYPEKQNSLVLIQGEYFLLLGVFWVHLYSCLELGHFPKIAVFI